MSDVLRFFVPGQPKTKGSLSVVNAQLAKARRAVVTDSPGSKRWRALVAYAARAELTKTGLMFPMAGPVELRLSYRLPVSAARLIEQGSGDIDKLDRNILDALQDAGVYANDAQVVRCWSEKHAHQDAPGVLIAVCHAGEQMG